MKVFGTQEADRVDTVMYKCSGNIEGEMLNGPLCRGVLMIRGAKAVRGVPAVISKVDEACGSSKCCLEGREAVWSPECLGRSAAKSVVVPWRFGRGWWGKGGCFMVEE